MSTVASSTRSSRDLFYRKNLALEGIVSFPVLIVSHGFYRSLKSKTITNLQPKRIADETIVNDTAIELCKLQRSPNYEA